MSRRFKINIEYDGTNYCGWQKQKENCSIQFLIENAIAPLKNGEAITVVGSGRTDAGVHAINQVAHFELDTKLQPGNIKKAINARTPKDILVRHCEEVDKSFHARFSAKKRIYLYLICKDSSVFYRNYTWQPKFDYDFSKLVECSKLILGEHDFTSFCSSSDESESRVSTIYEAKWDRKEKFIYFKISATRFLHSMVRMLVGTMMEVARGKYDLGEFKLLVGGKKLEKVHIYTAPSNGLFLYNIEY
jgi:tRNA pseudouridine38-40 synthase